MHIANYSYLNLHITDMSMIAIGTFLDLLRSCITMRTIG
jgi:hypothetical protein